jgi:hypothetical protein
MTSEPDGNAWGPAIDGMSSEDDPQTDDETDTNTDHDGERSSLAAFLGTFNPDDSDTDGDGRTGFLSTYVEFHALAIGLALGTVAVQTGNIEMIAAVIGAGAVGSRVQGGLPEKYLHQAKRELPYFVFGTGLAFIIGVFELGNMVGV